MVVGATDESRLGEQPADAPSERATRHGVRNRSDFRHESQLAAMNEVMGITTLLLPARPRMAAVSSTVLRGLNTRAVRE